MPRVTGRLLVIIAVGFVWETSFGPQLVAADPPRISSISPAGVCRGVTTEVVVQGANLAGRPRWLGSFDSGESPAAGGSAAGKSWRVRITPDPDVPVGVYLVRVQTDEGLSNPFPFAVDQVPRVAEGEENSSFSLAQQVNPPVVVEGQAIGSDVDYFRFAGRKGEKVVIDAACARIGSGVDPALRLSTIDHRLVGSADDSPGLLTDARLFAELPVDGDYVVEMADTRYQGAGPRTNYRLTIGRGVMAAATVFPLGGRRGETMTVELAGGTLPGSTPLPADVSLARAFELEPGRVTPWITEASAGLTAVDPVPLGGWFARDVEGLPLLAVGDAPESREPLDPTAPPTRAALPAVCNGRIESPRDTDEFVITNVTPGQKIRVSLEAAGLGSLLDGVLQVRGVKGAVLGTIDDSAIPAYAKPRVPAKPNAPKNSAILSLDPELIVTVPAETTEITVRVSDLQAEGGVGYPYRLTVEPVVPGFALHVSTADQVNIPRGGTAGVGVEVERQDFAGPITLKIANPPPGVTVRPGLIPAGQSVGSLSLSASADAAFAAATLQIVGEAAGSAGPIRVEATRTTILARQADFATAIVTRAGLPAAPASPSPISLTGPDAPVEVVLGYPATIPVQAIRSPGTEDLVLTFGSLPTVANLAIAADPKLAAKAVEGAITVNTNPDLPPEPVVVVFTATGKFAEIERTITLPAVTLNVVRPAEVELTTTRVELAAGASTEVKGTLIRRGGFHDPVTVKIDALPAGLKADSVVIPPEATRFTLKLSAGAEVKPFEATAKVVSSLKLGPKDYAPPPSTLAIKVVPKP